MKEKKERRININIKNSQKKFIEQNKLSYSEIFDNAVEQLMEIVRKLKE
jgi:hypothetical protein